MDAFLKILDVISNLVGHVAWPITTIIIIYWFKKPLSAFIGRITSVKHGDTSLDLHNVAEQVYEAVVPEEIKKLPPKKAIAKSFEELSATASTVASARAEVAGTVIPKTIEPTKYVEDDYVLDSYFSTQEADALKALDEYKNNVLSSKEVVTDASSNYYAALTKELQNQILESKIKETFKKLKGKKD